MTLSSYLIVKLASLTLVLVGLVLMCRRRRRPHTLKPPLPLHRRRPGPPPVRPKYQPAEDWRARDWMNAE